MSEQVSLNEKLDVFAGVLIRCFFMGVIGMTIWLAALVTVSDWAYQVHSKFIPITRQQFNVVHYAGLVTFKVTVFGLFLMPYIGIKLVQKRQRG